MQKSYKDALCGVNSNYQKNNVIIKKSPKKKRYKGKCKFYCYNNGCWKTEKNCKYYHEPLFRLKNPIIVFRCLNHHYNSDKIHYDHIVTTRDGIKFTVSDYPFFGNNYQLWQLCRQFNEEMWDDRYTFMESTCVVRGNDVNDIMPYLRTIKNTIKKIFLIRHMRQLPFDIINILVQKIMKIFPEYPKQFVYPICCD